MNIERLERIATHLEAGRPNGHPVFDFSTFNTPAGPACGSHGCAIGECPIVWPDEWMFSPHLGPVLRDKYGRKTIMESTMAWFALTEHEAYHLFFPDQQDQHLYGGEWLRCDALAIEVAANIRIFISNKTAS